MGNVAIPRRFIAHILRRKERTLDNLSIEQRDAIIFVDGGVLIGNLKEQSLDPALIRHIAQSQCPHILEAWLYTDDIKMPHMPQGFYFQRNALLLRWNEAGFRVIQNPRLGHFDQESMNSGINMQRDSAMRTKEMIDGNVGSDLLKCVRNYGGSRLHIFLVCGDADYIPIVNAAMDQGARVTILLTQANTFLQKGFPEQLNVIRLYKEEEENGVTEIDSIMQSWNSTKRTISSNTITLTPEIAGYISRLGTIQFICPVCKRPLLGIEEAGRHSHVPGHKLHVSDPPTVETIQTWIHLLSDARPWEFMEFVSHNIQRNASPEMIRELMAGVGFFQWDTVDTVLAFYRIHTRTMDGPAQISDLALHDFPKADLGALKLRRLTQEHNQKLDVPADIRSAFECYFSEIESRARLMAIARSLEHHGLISPMEVRMKLQAIIRNADERMAPFHTDGITVISALQRDPSLLPVEWDPYRMLYLLTSSHANLASLDLRDERSRRYWVQNKPMQTWAELLRMIAQEMQTVEELDEFANRIAYICGDLMDVKVLVLLFGNGILQLTPSGQTVLRVITHQALRPFLAQAEPTRDVA